MGQLIIDHSGLDKKPGAKWGLHELQTVSCVHCQAVIVLGSRGCTQFAISGTNILGDILQAAELPSEQTEQYGCLKCGQRICLECAKRMMAFGCPGPHKAQVERALEQQQK